MIGHGSKEASITNDIPDAALSSFPKNPRTSLVSYKEAQPDAYKYFTDIIKKRLERYTSEGVKECESSNERILKVYLSGHSDNSQYLHQALSSDNNLKSKIENLILDSRNESNTEAVTHINYMPHAGNKVPCRFKISSLGPCSKPPYGFDTFEPCFYLKINKVLDWKPVPFNTFSLLPGKVPEDVKEKIVKTIVPKIWTHCEGADDWDDTNFHDLKYYPEQSFDSNFFPYVRTPFYQSPLVAVQIIGLKSECCF
ncbi:uncharacterized protein LOC143918573 [Arctopsyche grandis]|uniref:uncharacterized protein LOC143918573 n=1 Tax=Arctopsyche grandis TaxID=121162 RepID=UPI00406D8B79